jgi:hypothetical protein
VSAITAVIPQARANATANERFMSVSPITSPR